MLGMQARRLLLGAAVDPEVRDEIRQTVLSFDEVENVVRLLTMQMGSRSVLVTGELQLSQDLDVGQAEYLMGRIDAALQQRLPEVTSTFWELRRHPVDTSVGPRIFN